MIGEMTVHVDRANLLETVRANRDAHRATFEIAMTRYREKMIEHLDAQIAALRSGKRIEHVIRMPVPEDHTSDYDATIRMLEMDVRDVVELDESSFRSYVLDEWAWTKNFIANTMSYAAS